MADVPIGTITYVDLKSNFSTMRIKVKPGESATKADVATLATVIDGYTACDRQAHAIVDKNIGSPTPAGNRDIKGVVTVMDENGSVHKYEIPGYNGEKEQDQEGDHMVDPDLAAIVTALETFTGYTFTTLRSPVIQKR